MCRIKWWLCQRSYQVHRVELERVPLSIPLGCHGDGQGFIGHCEQLSSRSFQFPSVQVDLKYTTWVTQARRRNNFSSLAFFYFISHTTLTTTIIRSDTYRHLGICWHLDRISSSLVTSKERSSVNRAKLWTNRRLSLLCVPLTWCCCGVQREPTSWAHFTERLSNVALESDQAPQHGGSSVRVWGFFRRHQRRREQTS